MSLIDQWQRRKTEIESDLAQGRIDPETAAKELAHIGYRLKRRGPILKRRQDRNAYRERQAEALKQARKAAERQS